MEDTLEVKLLTNQNSTTLNFTFFLFIIVISTFLMILMQYYWKIRRMVNMTAHLDGPKTYPIIGSALLFRGNTEEILRIMIELTDRCGSPCQIWLGHSLFLATSKPEHLEIIFNHPKSQERPDLYKFSKPVSGNGLFSAPMSIWKKTRKLIAPTFKQTVLNGFVSSFDEQAEILVNILDKHKGKMFDIKHLIGNFTLDAVAKTIMGAELCEQTKSSHMGKICERITQIVYVRMFQMWYHLDVIFYNTPIGKEFVRLNKEFTGFAKEIIAEKKRDYDEQKELSKLQPEAQTDEKPNKLKPLLELLFELNCDRKVLSDEQCLDEIRTFLIAGPDTTAVMLSLTLIMLGMHQDYQEKVYEEVMNVIGQDREINHDDLPNLKYTERFLLEANRLFPVGPIVVRQNTGDIDVGDCTLPAGSASVLMIIHTHRSAKYWPNPLKFDPDRFLPEEIAKRHPYCYLPFTAGPRICIGKKYGLMLMKVAVARIVRKFKITTSYKTVKEIRLQQDLLLQPVEGYPVRFEVR